LSNYFDLLFRLAVVLRGDKIFKWLVKAVQTAGDHKSSLICFVRPEHIAGEVELFVVCT